MWTEMGGTSADLSSLIHADRFKKTPFFLTNFGGDMVLEIRVEALTALQSLSSNQWGILK